MTASKARIRANNKYAQKAYDRISLFVPKGQKGTIEEAASKAGVSLNAFIGMATLDRLGLESWPDISEKETGPDA